MTAYAATAEPAVVDGALIVAEARTWIGTPWQHQAPLKGIGCDCVGFVRGVLATFVDLPEALLRADYARTPDGVTLLQLCRAHLLELPRAHLGVGDIVVFAYRLGRPQHLGFAADYVHGGLSLIHALDHASARDPGSVVEHGFTGAWRRRVVAVFRLPAP